jgi:hypothetical protein
MPPRARTSKATPPADLDAKKPANADASPDLDALRAEVRAESDSDDGIEYLAVPLGNTTVRVKRDPLDWPGSANSYFARGLMTEWAQRVVHPDDFAQVWLPTDPTNRQIAAFIAEWEKISGLPLAQQFSLLSS